MVFFEKTNNKKKLDVPVLKLFENFYKKKEKGPYCFIIKNNYKLILNDYQLCKKNLLKIYK